MYNEKIIDITTGEETIRPFTKAEIDAIEKAAAQEAAKQAAIDAELAQKQAEKERIATALGLTLDELKVLLS